MKLDAVPDPGEDEVEERASRISERIGKINILLDRHARGMMILYDLWRSCGVGFDRRSYVATRDGTKYRITLEVVKPEEDKG